MRIVGFETFLANAGLRNYLFIRLRTDTGLTGVGEATLEWQEKAVETLAREWVAERVIGRDPFDVESIVGGMIRDQYQGGSTVMTAISGAEIALWDLIGKACGQPVYRLLGGRCHGRIPAYANGWYGGAQSPSEFAERARDAVARGYRALKFDPFGTAWKVLTPAEADAALEVVAAVREAVGAGVELMIEFHGRLAAGTATALIRRLERFQPAWCEEPVAPECLDLLAEVKRSAACPDRRRRATLHAGRFLPADRAPRCRHRADGCRPLWRHPGRRRRSLPWPMPRTCALPLIARSVRSLWRPPAF